MHLLILLFKPEVKDVTCFTHYRWHISQHLSCLAFILTPSLQFATYSFPVGYLRLVANLLFPYNAYCPSFLLSCLLTCAEATMFHSTSVEYLAVSGGVLFTQLLAQNVGLVENSYKLPSILKKCLELLQRRLS